jgi:hypothetical protein
MNIDLRQEERHAALQRNGPYLTKALDSHIEQQNREMLHAIAPADRELNRIEDVTQTIDANYNTVQAKVDMALHGAPSEPPVPLADQEPQHQSFTHPLGGGQPSLLHHFRAQAPTTTAMVASPTRCACATALLVVVALALILMTRR